MRVLEREGFFEGKTFMKEEHCLEQTVIPGEERGIGEGGDLGRNTCMKE